jgi:hypothetical protein
VPPALLLSSECNIIILLRKMQHYGFGTNVIKWFNSYLAGRSSFADIRSSKAEFAAHGIGVPQGSVWGLSYSTFT